MKQWILTAIIVCMSIGGVVAAQEICTMEYDPVCGVDGVTYGNACTAGSNGVVIDYAGSCLTGSELDQALSMAYQFGITKYKTLDKFMPNNALSREQVAKMMFQFAKTMERSLVTGDFVCEFTDLQLSDPTLTNYILSACELGMIKGWNNQFHPQDTVTYAQAITMLMRVVDGVKAEGDLWRSPYEQQALASGYLSQSLTQPLAVITRGELIVWMNKIYKSHTQSRTTYETWVIADSTTPCMGVGKQQCLQIRRNGGAIELFYDTIEGFTFVPGYEYMIQVVGKPVDNPAADASSIQRSLVNVEEYRSTNGKPTTLPGAGCDWIKIDTLTLSVRGQQCETQSGSVTISYDQALPGVILSTKQFGITTQVPLVHLFISPQSTGLQQLLFNTHNNMIKQGLVSKSAACMFAQNASTVGSRVDRYDFIVDTAISAQSDCGSYSVNDSGTNYFVKPKTSTTLMIYINNSEMYRSLIDWGSLLIK